MEIRNLITFVHVAELNSFTTAAKVLGYSQSTISFQIKQLETELDCMLFERINHTVSLTEKGRELLAYAQKISHLTGELKQERIMAHFVTSASAPVAIRKNLSVRDIVKQPFILTEKKMGYRRVLDEELAKMSMEIQPVLEIGRTDLIVNALERGVGVSFLPDFVTEKKVAYIEVKDFEIEIWKQLIYHRNKWISRPLDAFISYVMKNEFNG